MDVKLADGTTTQRAVPAATYASAPVSSCQVVPEPDRSDKPAYVRRQNYTITQGQAMCASQMRAIMTADDEFAATMQLLQNKGVLDNTLVVLSSDNGYLWGEHGRWEKFTPYEPVMRVPIWLRWPGHVTTGTDTTRLVSLIDFLPTFLQAAGVSLPAGAPPLDGESLLAPSQPDDGVRRVLRRHGRQPQHPVVAHGAHPDREVRAHPERRGRGDRPRVLRPRQRPERADQPARRRQRGQRPAGVHDQLA